MIVCRECDSNVSSEAKVCPHCGIDDPWLAIDEHNPLFERSVDIEASRAAFKVGKNSISEHENRKKSSGVFRNFLVAAVAIVGLIYLLGLLSGGRNDEPSTPGEIALANIAKRKNEIANEKRAKLAEKTRIIEAKRARILKVAKEKENKYFWPTKTQVEFIRAVTTARLEYRNAVNDLAKGGVRRNRAKSLCRLLPKSRVQDWSGKLYNLTTNGDGLGVVTIDLGNQVWVKTWNNSLSDIGSNSMMDPDSGVFRKFSVLKEGQRIRFSGRLIRKRSAPDCFEESSITMNGSMDEPEFIIRFSNVETYQK